MQDHTRQVLWRLHEFPVIAMAACVYWCRVKVWQAPTPAHVYGWHRDSLVHFVILSAMAAPIFENGILRPGIYKIRDVHSGDYLDIEVPSREMCCRPEENLEQGRGLVRL